VTATHTRAIGGLLMVLLMSRPLGAQHHSALDVGFTLVRFPDDSSVVFGPSLEWSSAAEGRRTFGEVTAGGVGTVGAATGSASATAGARTHLLPGLLLEGSGELFGIAGSSTHSAATATASARIIGGIGRLGAWAGASSSLGRRESGNMPAQAIEAGAWWRVPRARLSVRMLEQRARGQLFTGDQRQLLIGTVPVHYFEGSVGLHVEGDLTALDLSAGARRDPDAETLVEPVLSVTAAMWRSPTRALTVTLSRQPPDYVRGADAARWLAIGMRFYERTPAAVRAARVRPIIQMAGDDGARVLRVRAAGAHRVELMADFTDWEPIELSITPTGFEHPAKDIEAGSHRILVRVDGGEWRPAANTPAVNDDLGGRVGLLVVP
jgi:hypothetical protein